MRFSEHEAAGRRMSEEEVRAGLRALGQDPRFGAVVGWLERNREAFVMAGSSQGLAGEHGKLAHVAGSIHALNVLRGQLANVMEAGGAQGGMPEPDAGEDAR